MIDLSSVKRIDRSAPGSFAALRQLQRALNDGNFDELARMLEKYGVDVEAMAIADLEPIIRHIIGETTPLVETTGG